MVISIEFPTDYTQITRPINGGSLGTAVVRKEIGVFPISFPISREIPKTLNG
jgi:hypothetical protein